MYIHCMYIFLSVHCKKILKLLQDYTVHPPPSARHDALQWLYKLDEIRDSESEPFFVIRVNSFHTYSVLWKLQATPFLFHIIEPSSSNSSSSGVAVVPARTGWLLSLPEIRSCHPGRRQCFHRAVEVSFFIPLRWARVEQPTDSSIGDMGLRFRAEYVAAMAPW